MARVPSCANLSRSLPHQWTLNSDIGISFISINLRSCAESLATNASR